MEWKPRGPSGTRTQGRIVPRSPVDPLHRGPGRCGSSGRGRRSFPRGAPGGLRGGVVGVGHVEAEDVRARRGQSPQRVPEIAISAGFGPTIPPTVARPQPKYSIVLPPGIGVSACASRRAPSSACGLPAGRGVQVPGDRGSTGGDRLGSPVRRRRRAVADLVVVGGEILAQLQVRVVRHDGDPVGGQDPREELARLEPHPTMPISREDRSGLEEQDDQAAGRRERERRPPAPRGAPRRPGPGRSAGTQSTESSGTGWSTRTRKSAGVRSGIGSPNGAVTYASTTTRSTEPPRGTPRADPEAEPSGRALPLKRTRERWGRPLQPVSRRKILRPRMALSPGSRLGPYEILAPLGAGGMGEVYRARDPRLGRDVAIKVLPAEVASDSERLHRFEKEARAASALNHPNIVTIHDIGREGSVSYIAMEFVEGSTVRDLLAGGPLPTRRLLAVAAQTAEGLARAHEAGIVHRDLKPENLMITRDGFVKILDFGLAKLTGPPEGSGEATRAPTVSAGTEPGVVMGTVAYMSPEQAAGGMVDFRSDQFSLGSILYEMAAGKKPFAGETRPEVMAAIIRQEPEPLASVAPKMPTAARWIVERCLAKDPVRALRRRRAISRGI